MRYIGHTVLRIVGLCLLIFSGLLAVFAIEKFSYLLDIAFRYKVDFANFMILYVALLPDVADFILPIALVIACYVILLQKREAREFLVWSSAGDGARTILLTAAWVGTIAVVLCVLLSGFVKPAASLLFRQHYAQAFADALSSGLPGGNFYPQDDSVLFVASAALPNATKMRVFGFDDDRLKRLTVSNCASLRAVGGEVRSDLCDTRVYLFGFDAQAPSQSRLRQGLAPVGSLSRCRLCAGPDGGLDIVRLEAGQSSIRFRMESVFGSPGTAHDKDRSLANLLTLRDGAIGSPADARRAATYLLLALTCLVAVAAALAAIAATAHRTGIFALCGALGLVIAAMVVVQSGLLLVGPLTNPAYLAALLLGGCVICAAAIAFIAIRFHTRLVTPMFVKG
jgi:lipopolysaccharide export LptBFGC system permease protein LptF